MAKKKYRTTREYLDTAAKIVTGQRQYDYGDKYQNHKNITHQFYFNRIEFRFYSYPDC